MPDWLQTLPPVLLAVILVALFALGVFFLVRFSDIFVDAACAVANKLKVSPLIIGLTVVAFGTSCPELAVSVSDSVSTLIEGGNANVAIGNVVGSNICNLLVVLGCSAIFTPILVQKPIIRKQYPVMIGVTVLLVLFGLFFGIGSTTGNYAITRAEGVVLLLCGIAYVAFLVLDAKRHPEEQEDPELLSDKVRNMSTGRAILFIFVGLVGIVLGGEAVVFSAKNLAYEIGDAAQLNHDLVESLVGLTIVAVGTSLPELVTSVIAAKKKQNEIALGNVIGSNVFNALYVLGFAGIVNPLTTGNQIVVDLFVMLGATLLVYLIALRGKIRRWHGALLLLCYAGYLAYLIARTIVG